MSSSGSYNSSRGLWEPEPDRGEDHRCRELSLATWNVWFGREFLEARARALLAELETLKPDIIGLQEVTAPFLEILTQAPWIREHYRISKPDVAHWSGYGNLLLSRLPFRSTTRSLPSRMNRALLLGHFRVNGGELLVGVVHLDSKRASAPVRAAQLTAIFPKLADGPTVLMGDFNFCGDWPEENDLLDPTLTDLWPLLRPDERGDTVDTRLNLMRFDLKRKHKLVRFDRILFRPGESGLKPVDIDRLGLRPIDKTLPRMFASDHFGLFARLRV